MTSVFFISHDIKTRVINKSATRSCQRSFNIITTSKFYSNFAKLLSVV